VLGFQRREGHVPEWDCFGDGLFYYFVKIFVLLRMQVVDVRNNPNRN
jgi:hypothetical protein